MSYKRFFVQAHLDPWSSGSHLPTVLRLQACAAGIRLEESCFCFIQAFLGLVRPNHMKQSNLLSLSTEVLIPSKTPWWRHSESYLGTM
jgi:hypothetical protein